MARVIKENGTIKFFAITQGVGDNMPKIPTDSTLVLYLLCKYAAYRTSYETSIGVPAFDPSRDYNNRKVVTEAIRRFQAHHNKLIQQSHAPKSSMLKVDGKAYCLPGWLSSKLYTIQQINYSYQAAVITFFSNQQDPMELALNDHQMPLMLRTELVASSVFNGVL